MPPQKVQNKRQKNKDYDAFKRIAIKCKLSGADIEKIKWLQSMKGFKIQMLRSTTDLI